MAEENQKKTNLYREGVPMSEEALKEWQKTFTDIEDSIKYLEKHDENGTDKKNKRTTKQKY